MSDAGKRRTVPQSLRFIVVGVLNNLGGYLLYIAVTWAGVDPKLTVAMFYPVAVLINYLTHARYSFDSRGDHGRRLPRYIVVYMLALLVNLGMLALFHDRMGFRHEFVQFAAFGVVGTFLFFSMKFFVFSPASTHVDQDVPGR